MAVYVTSKKSNRKVIHKPGCPMIHRIEEENRYYFESLQAGQKEGYHICKYCISMIKKSVSPKALKNLGKKDPLLPKQYVVVDLEMSAVAKENSEFCGKCWQEIIQIGAVLLDSNYQEIGHFNTLVKPQYNSVIGRKYEKLTGIKTEMVQEAPVFSKAIKMFLDWCKSIPNEIEILQWSTNDLNQITKEMELKRYFPTLEEQKYLENWSDFQEEFSKKLKKNSCISLEKALFYSGIEQVGKLHDALDDARNTGRLLMFTRDKHTAMAFEENVVNVMKPKRFGTSLGDLLQNYPVSM